MRIYFVCFKKSSSNFKIIENFRFIFWACPCWAFRLRSCPQGRRATG
ncbi:MAG: hypothetical protein RML94_08055 [Bacteroidia bacterium]|nr:hypothetical protein [Bacteroidia bacterium]